MSAVVKSADLAAEVTTKVERRFARLTNLPAHARARAVRCMERVARVRFAWCYSRRSR